MYFKKLANMFCSHECFHRCDECQLFYNYLMACVEGTGRLDMSMDNINSRACFVRVLGNMGACFLTAHQAMDLMPMLGECEEHFRRELEKEVVNRTLDDWNLPDVYFANGQLSKLRTTMLRDQSWMSFIATRLIQIWNTSRYLNNNIGLFELEKFLAKFVCLKCFESRSGLRRNGLCRECFWNNEKWLWLGFYDTNSILSKGSHLIIRNIAKYVQQTTSVPTYRARCLLIYAMSKLDASNYWAELAALRCLKASTDTT